MLAYDYEKLQIAVSSIHALVGAPVNIYDVEYQNIVRPQEPWNKEAFCYLMLRETQETAMACRKCYLTAFRETAKTKQMSYFKCHAGLTCVVVPIVHEDMVYGYLTLSEVTDEADYEKMMVSICECCHDFSITQDELKKRGKRVRYISRGNLLAAASLMEMAAQSIIFSGAVFHRDDAFAIKMNQYIDDHLCEQITVNTLCRVFGFSRTALYAICNACYGCGIASHIRNRRVLRAKELLKNSKLFIYEIAEKTGFAQYGTFYSFFTKSVGLSPEEYRKTCKT